MNAMHKLALIGAAILCAGALAGCGQNGNGAAAGGAVAEERPSITVNASSEVKAAPDRAEIGLAVTTQAQTAEEAQAANAQSVDAVVAALTGLGIAEKSIQTTDTYLSPRYDYSEVPLAGAAADDAGFEMVTRLSVSDLAIDQVGAVLEAGVSAGATNADGIRYYVSDYDKVYAQALKESVAAAREKAQVLAEAAGTSLGGVLHIEEGYQNTAYRYETADSLAMGVAEDSGAMKVMPGELDVTAQVTVTYEIS